MSQPITTKAPQPVPIELLGNTFVRCGCGFAACSEDQYYNVLALENHPCPHTPPRLSRAPMKWHESLFSSIFSFWGVMALVAISLILVLLLK